jgi:hypothetical protein
MPRFVILEHDHPTLHWDLLLESGTILRAWRLSSPPAEGAVIPAQGNTDHRLFYLDYEGPISGGRGTVKRWDAGEFAFELQGDGPVEVKVEGMRLRGTIILQPSPDRGWNCMYRAASRASSPSDLPGTRDVPRDTSS